MSKAVCLVQNTPRFLNDFMAGGATGIIYNKMTAKSIVLMVNSPSMYVA